ncbi:MAG: helix-turn-helix domain-containing protein [Kiritimatiellae bacterium]|nr:helix-turn-helix domain-containing protein [Kiritimatiellia bacterium]
MGGTKPIQSLLRGLDALRLLADAPDGMRLSDVAEAMELKLPTVHNLVRTLGMRHLVARTDGTRYVIGPGLLELAGLARGTLREMRAETVVRRLADLDCAPIVNYSVPVADQLAVRLRMSPDVPNRMQRPSHQVNRLYGTATGLAFLAFAPPDQVLSFRQAHPFHEEGVRLWGSPEELEAALEGFRERGCAITPFPKQELYRVCAPVRDRDEVAYAYLGVAVHVERMHTKPEQRRLTEAVVTGAAELSGPGEPDRPQAGGK